MPPGASGLDQSSPSRTPNEPSARLIAHNVRRLMAGAGMTYEDVIAATGLDGRTIRRIVRSHQAPQARTLSRLAEGFGVEADELFAPPPGLTPEAFDAACNPVVEQVKESHPEVFAGWSPAEFAELASRFGVGGELTEAGALETAEQMNAHRAVLQKARVVLESSHAEMLTELVEMLYDRVVLKE